MVLVVSMRNLRGSKWSVEHLLPSAECHVPSSRRGVGQRICPISGLVRTVRGPGHWWTREYRRSSPLDCRSDHPPSKLQIWSSAMKGNSEGYYQPFYIVAITCAIQVSLSYLIR